MESQARLYAKAAKYKTEHPDARYSGFSEMETADDKAFMEAMKE